MQATLIPLIMKKVLSIFFVVFIAQSLKSQTTSDEFNFARSGYKDVSEKGINMKTGYRVDDVSEGSSGSGDTKRKVWLKSLIKTSTNKTVCYIMVFQLRDNSKEYYCVPHPGSTEEIKNKFWHSLDVNDKSYARLGLMMFVMSDGLKW
jgi:hypothetical protein